MKGNESIMAVLNELLADELTAINQYMVHSEMADVQGLDSGADDYLTKPFAFEEFPARADTFFSRAQHGRVCRADQECSARRPRGPLGQP